MTTRSVLAAGFAAGVLLCAARTGVNAQEPQGKPDKAPKPFTQSAIFKSSEPLHVTLTAPVKQLRRQRSGTVPYQAAEITYAGDSGQMRVPVRVRPRGIWRRKNCDIPPLRLNFAKDSVKKTEFRHLDGARLVLHCRDSDDYEQYVLQEFQLYRVQRLLTPLSLDARLVRVTYLDAEKKDTVTQRYGFVLEDEKTFGERMGGKVVETKGASGDDLDGYESALFGVFEYFIGNTDYSIGGLHNAVVLFKDTAYYPMAYDFDFSGAVNTRYATPPPQIPIRRVTERVMRGYCTDPEHYQKVFGLFREKKDAIYALYRDSLGALLKPQVVERTLKYFDEFYEVINDERAANRYIVKACLNSRA